MSAVKRYAWNVTWYFMLFSLLLGIAAEIASADETVLLDFYADWCGPCQQMAPVVDQLAAEGYSVRKINIEHERALAVEHGVDVLPCFVVVSNGKTVDRVTGVTTIDRLKIKLQRKPVHAKPHDGKQPTPAWRYERPERHRAAIVRVYCQDDARTRSIGSGVLIRVGKRICVLTARHVVQDAKSILVELFTKKTHRARVVKVDAVWDCALLEVEGRVEGVEPVELEYGDDAMQRAGERLETCGYGGDGQLAVNTGLFIGYRRSNQSPNGPDDWMVVSGRARQGDSGGPVFNQRGRVVGVLWGTDGREVVCVQVGRIHKMLGELSVEYQRLSFIDRTPTPSPAAPMVPVPRALPGYENCQPGSGCCPPSEATPYTEALPTAGASKSPLLPWRGKTEDVNRSQAEAIDRLIELERMRQSQPPVVQMPPPAYQPPAVQEPTQEEASASSPLLAVFGVLVGVAAGFVLYFAGGKGR